MPQFPFELPAQFGTPTIPEWNAQHHPNHKVVSDEQIISIHTNTGIQLYQFLTNNYTKLRWTRALRETSICDLNVPKRDGHKQIPNIMPWLHWISVWSGDQRDLYWRGPITRAEQGRDWINLSAADTAVFARATRVQLTKRWDAADPAEIAAEHWHTLIDHHGLNIRATTRLDPRGDRFDYHSEADKKMVDQIIDELVDLGLYWTIIAGIPLLGPAPHNQPITSLGEQHFVDGELSIIRDGTNTYNDVLLRAGDHVSRAKVPMAGLNLQTIITRDTVFGVDNADRAAYQAVRYMGAIRDAISVPRGATLRPNAPVNIRQLIPSARLNLGAYDLLTTVELEGITVEATQGRTTLAIDVESVNDDLPELIEPERKQQ